MESEPGEGERSGDGAEKGEGHFVFQRAHFPDVLFVVHAHDDRAGAEEEQALEEGVGEEVEHRNVPRFGHADAQNHVAELRDG